MEKNKGGWQSCSTTAIEQVPTITEMGLTHNQSSKYQQLAESLAQTR